VVALLALLLPGCTAASGPGPQVSLSPAHQISVVIEVVPAADLPGPAGIESAQDQVIAAIPPDRGSVSRRYRSLPYLGALIDPALLPALLKLPAVAAIRPDRVMEIVN
jgi:hypothetical protein